MTTGLYLPFGIGPFHGLRVRLNDALCRFAAARHHRAVIHQTYYGDSVYPRTRPLVITVYDLINELYRDRFSRFNIAGDPTRRYQRVNCARADHLIAISEATKADLVRLFGVDPARITVVHLASSLPVLQPLEPGRAPPAESGGSEEKRYLLHVGGRPDYKNFNALLEAFGRSAFLRRRFRLVCFGGGPFDDAERERIAALGVSDRVIHRSGDDAALAACYRDATAFICPSLYEGFGLPVLEAMSQGCPVICAHAGSLPEVAGAAAVYFDPTSVESMQAALDATLDDEARLAALRLLGLERVRLFSWERCARETLQVYRRLAA